jgi:hypothetical protein
VSEPPAEEPPEDRPPDEGRPDEQRPDDQPPARPPAYRLWRWQVWAFGAIAVVWAIVAAVSSRERAIALGIAVVAALLAVNAARR